MNNREENMKVGDVGNQEWHQTDEDERQPKGKQGRGNKNHGDNIGNIVRNKTVGNGQMAEGKLK